MTSRNGPDLVFNGVGTFRKAGYGIQTASLRATPQGSRLQSGGPCASPGHRAFYSSAVGKRSNRATTRKATGRTRKAAYSAKHGSRVLRNTTRANPRLV